MYVTNLHFDLYYELHKYKHILNECIYSIS